MKEGNFIPLLFLSKKHVTKLNKHEKTRLTVIFVYSSIDMLEV